jgi:hypothetical protein
MLFKVITDTTGTKCLATTLFEKEIRDPRDFTDEETTKLDEIGKRAIVSFTTTYNEGVILNDVEFSDLGANAMAQIKEFLFVVK